MKSYTNEVLEELDAKLDEIDMLIHQLPLKDSVKNKMIDTIFALWEEIEDNLDMTPVDYE